MRIVHEELKSIVSAHPGWWSFYYDLLNPTAFWGIRVDAWGHYWVDDGERSHNHLRPLSYSDACEGLDTPLGANHLITRYVRSLDTRVDGAIAAHADIAQDASLLQSLQALVAERLDQT